MKNLKNKLAILSCSLVLIACAGDPVRVSMLQNIYKFTGDSGQSAILVASDLVEIKGGIQTMQGRAYIAGIDSKLTSDKLPKGELGSLNVDAGKRNLTIRYFDGSNVQCQVNFVANLTAGKTYKAILESEPNRANIKIGLRELSSNSLVQPLELAGRISEDLNFPRVLPLGTPAKLNKTGCY